MRILFLTRSFNSLAQRLYLELSAAGHELAVEFDISDAVTLEAAALFRPDLVIAPFLKRAIPEALWRHTVCLVVHPGVVGDRGPSALDWAISEGVSQWGVTVLQANAEMDAGAVWASETFAMREASKSSLYRREVTDAALRAVHRAVAHFSRHGTTPPPAPPPAPGAGWRPLMSQSQRRIDWARDDSATVLRKLRAADGAPGVLDSLFGVPCHLFDGHAGPADTRHPPGQIIGRRDEALLRATRDGAVWIGHVRRVDGDGGFKLPAALAFAEQARAVPEWPPPATGACEIRHQVLCGVGVLRFAFYNGAMGTAQCERLNAALRDALRRPERVLMLCGGPEFWSNGLHLNVIEAADSPADESWRNINAIDDLTRTLIEATDRWVIAALQGNAGAGGVFMALAADAVWARRSVVLNPHYKNMGNLYGSEYWSYLLPRRLRGAGVDEVMGRRLPLSAARAAELGLLDAVFGDSVDEFMALALERAAALAASPALSQRLAHKQQQRQRDEATRPLAAYREAELARMRRNFYGFDPSYHIARSNFVHRVLPSWTPRHLASHRRREAPAG